MGGGPQTQILSYSSVDKLCLSTPLNLSEVNSMCSFNIMFLSSLKKIFTLSDEFPFSVGTVSFFLLEIFIINLKNFGCLLSSFS